MTTEIVRHATLRLDVAREYAYEQDMPKMLKRLGLADSPQEAVWIIAHDAEMHVRTVVEISRGAYAKASVHLPSLLAAVLVTGCDRFDMAHNHPSGNPTPTKTDIDITVNVMAAANACGLWFEDHWIVTPKGPHTSMRQSGIIVPLPYTGEVAS